MRDAPKLTPGAGHAVRLAQEHGYVTAVEADNLLRRMEAAQIRCLPKFRRADEDHQYGTAGMPQIYEAVIILRGENLRIHETARIDSFTKLECGIGFFIGAHVHIASFCHLGIGGGVTILEEGASFGSGAKIMSGSNVPAAGRSCSAIAPGNQVRRSFVHVRKNAVVFAGAIVLPGVTIGEGAVVGAGALVREDVPAGEVWAGIPARKVGMVTDGDPERPGMERLSAMLRADLGHGTKDARGASAAQGEPNAATGEGK